MPLLKKWQEIVRTTHIDEGIVLRRAIKQHIKIMGMIGKQEHIQNPGKYLEEMTKLGNFLSNAHALSIKCHDILENNSKPTPDEERWAFVEEVQERANRARRRE